MACELCQKLPKAELHAHISGSYSSETVKKLAKLAGQDDSKMDWITKDIFGFDEVFKYFGLAQTATCSQEAVYIGTGDVIEDFKADNVNYLELRTTPKNDGTMTPSQHIGAVVKAIEEAEHKNWNSESGQSMVVKLILSVDRRRSLEVAANTVRLASEFKRHIVGIDLSGDPRVNDARTYLPVLRDAKLSGWRLALHLSEVENQDVETEAILAGATPDRIGHGTFLKDAIAETVHKSKIPLELCLTSNVAGMTVPSFDDHHIYYWYKRNHPVAICTDDKGAFRTNLSKELHIAHRQLFHMHPDENQKRSVIALVRSGIEAGFLSKDSATPAEWSCIQAMKDSLAKVA